MNTQQAKSTKTKFWGAFDKSNKQHSTILSLLRQADWVTSHPVHGEVADLGRLAEFLKSDKSPVKKPLMDMDKQELSKIIIALEGITKHENSKW